MNGMNGMNEDLQEVVSLIVKKSPSTAADALKVLRSSAPMIRLRAIAPAALSEGEWSDEERSLLMDAISSPPDSGMRSKVVTLRLTETEYADLVAAAEESTTSISDYIRVALGL